MASRLPAALAWTAEQAWNAGSLPGVEAGFSVVVNWTKNGQPKSQALNVVLQKGNNYQVTGSSNIYLRYDDSDGDSLFAPATTSPGTKYLHYWVDTQTTADLSNLWGDYAGGGIANVNMSISYSATVTHLGDSVGSKLGWLTSASGSRFRDPSVLPDGPYHAEASVAAASLQFAVTNLDASSPIPGAVFRLSQLGHQDHYLASDGNYYTATDARPNGVNFIEATSNTGGIVTFSGLPIFDSTGKALAADRLVYALQEYRAPAGYAGPTVPFEKVDFSAFAGKSLSQLVAEQASTGLVPQMSALTFGRFASPISSAHDFADADGRLITVGVVNWQVAAGENQPPGTVNQIPLTGGRGIALILLAGVGIMAAAIFYRHRRQEREDRQNYDTNA